MNQANQLLLYLACKHPLHNPHRLSIGNPHALNELTLQPYTFEGRFDLRSAAMHHHRAHAQHVQQHHVLRKRLLQGWLGHGIATVFEHDGLALVFADQRCGIHQGVGRQRRRNVRSMGRLVHDG